MLREARSTTNVKTDWLGLLTIVTVGVGTIVYVLAHDPMVEARRRQAAYTAGPIDSCQVRVEADGPRAIRLSQIPLPGAPMRTLVVRVE